MKANISIIVAAAVLSLSACCRQGEQVPVQGLKARLEAAVTDGKILFGHQDALMYGHSWKAGAGDSLDRSDVRDVCGSYPVIMGLDLGGIELGDSANLDGNLFSQMREAAIAHHERGGIVTFSWHPRNPLTGGDSWDVSSNQAVASVMEGGENHGKFMAWLKSCADFLLSIKDGQDRPVPMIFRPWHEHTGSWFWWGLDLCTDEEYAQLWKMTRETMDAAGLDQLLWAYSPNAGVDAETYMHRYPGDDMVDILGMDFYQFGEAPASNQPYMDMMKQTLAFMTKIGQEHGKLIAVTETGFEGIPYEKWWTEVLLPAVKDAPVAYLLVWRNAHDKPGHFYAPWPGAACGEDFKAFAQSGEIVLLGD